MRDYIDGALYWLRVRADWAASGEEWTVGRYGSTAYDGGPGWSELLGRENEVPLAWADLIEIGPLIGKEPPALAIRRLAAAVAARFDERARIVGAVIEAALLRDEPKLPPRPDFGGENALDGADLMLAAATILHGSRLSPEEADRIWREVEFMRSGAVTDGMARNIMLGWAERALASAQTATPHGTAPGSCRS